ncbi:SDR family NAD(P)-dependent oxidoreductase [Saccharopolyspora sp. HNM0983]|uniref:SDR family NAD(P)-dependent oxidoreductase n=1 Tax=Saccharopolyspora montiporae TaxID=2781240 RepID=A0A929BAS2_9PSEU|nr:SDR family NAD(P)-dependent oxidoreductase [Saccharopolyspora sp. HNM0983]MBE9376429.1 SDR family NAD(P)-dependent oxidoreductase [Saccharopolyspora sp. HNM0983]
MPTIAIVGAGQGLGLSIAKVFGGRGFDVALISRTKDKLDTLVAELGETGITAEGFAADVADPSQLTNALETAIARFGRIDVLEFSPHAGLTMTAPKDVTLNNLRPQIDSLLYGAVAAAQAVLPGMLEARSGTLLFTTGGGAINPYPMLADSNIAQAGQRNWAINLHNTLADEGIYVANVAINLMIANQAPEDVPHRAPDEIALDYWNVHTERAKAEHVIGA